MFQGTPGNLSIGWYRDNVPIAQVTSMQVSDFKTLKLLILNRQSSFKEHNKLLILFVLQGRVTVKPEGALIISPIKSEDAGTYICEVTNGIGRPQRAPAILEVTCKLVA